MFYLKKTGKTVKPFGRLQPKHVSGRWPADAAISTQRPYPSHCRFLCRGWTDRAGTAGRCFYRDYRHIRVITGPLIDKPEPTCACVGSGSNVPLGCIFLSEKLIMMAMNVWIFDARIAG